MESPAESAKHFWKRCCFENRDCHVSNITIILATLVFFSPSLMKFRQIRCCGSVSSPCGSSVNITGTQCSSNVLFYRWKTLARGYPTMKPVLLRPLQLHNLPQIKHPIRYYSCPSLNLEFLRSSTRVVAYSLHLVTIFMWREGST